MDGALVGAQEATPELPRQRWPHSDDNLYPPCIVLIICVQVHAHVFRVIEYVHKCTAHKKVQVHHERTTTITFWLNTDVAGHEYPHGRGIAKSVE